MNSRKAVANWLTGEHHIEIRTKFVKYVLDLRRKITVLTGDGANGKTYLCEQVRYRLARITADVDVNALDAGDVDSWEDRLSKARGMDVFIIDETFSPMLSKAFARAVFSTDAYFVFITRTPLTQMPYSVHEVYKFSDTHVGGEYYYLRRMVPLFSDERCRLSPDVLVTEDSGSGFEFFRNAVDCKCVSAYGNSNVANVVASLKSGVAAVVVDGAAFGAFVGKTLNAMTASATEVYLYTPESFEYLLLMAGAARIKKKYLERPFDYCDDAVYMTEFGEPPAEPLKSWERYFTSLLMLASGDRYSKDRLNPYFLRFKERVLSLLEEFG